MSIEPDETDLVGDWIFDGKTNRADATCERIKELTASVLKQVAVSKQWGAWETLFQDPADGRYWERTYPKGEMHGGGPPRLTNISEAEAREKYEFD